VLGCRLCMPWVWMLLQVLRGFCRGSVRLSTRATLNISILNALRDESLHALGRG
jgi:hypothetical protein